MFDQWAKNFTSLLDQGSEAAEKMADGDAQALDGGLWHGQPLRDYLRIKASLKSQANVSIIVLAAGSSRRMGETNKLLLPWKISSIIKNS